MRSAWRTSAAHPSLQPVSSRDRDLPASCQVLNCPKRQRQHCGERSTDAMYREVVEIIRRFQDERPHPLGLPFLAGMDEIYGVDRDQLEKLDLLQMQQAVAFHYCVRTDLNAEPEWLLRWLESRPEMIADVLVQCAAAISSGTLQVPGLYELVQQKHYAAVAAYACLPLLKEYPPQQEPERLDTLNQLLWSALRHSDGAALQNSVREKLSCPDILVAQRIHWLSAGVILAPESYRGSLESTVVGADDRIREMASFFSPEEALALPVEGLDVIHLTNHHTPDGERI